MSLIKKPADIKPSVLFKSLIYGQPGIGKTTAALSSPNALLLDFDGGINRVQHTYQKDVVQVSSWKDVEAVLKEDLSNYKTIVIDTVDKLLDFMTKDLISSNSKNGQRDGNLTQKGYGARKSKFKNFVSQISLMGKHLVFVAHEKEQARNEEITLRPDIGGSSGSDLIKDMHLVGYMEAHGIKRTISFSPCERFYAKNSCELDPVIEFPVLKGQENNFIEEIFNRIIAANSQKKEIAKKYSDLVVEISEVLEGLEDAETANKFVAWIKTVHHIWDSKLIASMKMRKKIKDMEIIYNVETGQYEDPEIPGQEELDQQMQTSIEKE